MDTLDNRTGGMSKNVGGQFSKEGYKIRNILRKVNILKGNHYILLIDLVVSRQTLGIILENKVI